MHHHVRDKGQLTKSEDELMSKNKPVAISKSLVWHAYLKIKKNGGSAGVDGESLKSFEKELDKNLYKIWNRLSSGSYYPPPVKGVPVPKKAGGEYLPRFVASGFEGSYERCLDNSIYQKVASSPNVFERQSSRTISRHASGWCH